MYILHIHPPPQIIYLNFQNPSTHQQDISNLVPIVDLANAKYVNVMETSARAIKNVIF